MTEALPVLDSPDAVRAWREAHGEFIDVTRT
jgi:hypothetical protein